jgi:WXG100 family type VII secretion target
MAAKIRMQYTDMGQAAQALSQEGQNIQTLYSQLKGQTESLHNNGWKGRGADAFFKEMEGTILPAVQKLNNALDHSADTINKIHQIFQNAETEAAQLFKVGN